MFASKNTKSLIVSKQIITKRLKHFKLAVIRHAKAIR